jgi:hypothetical protein
LQSGSYRVVIVDYRYEFAFLVTAHKRDYALAVKEAQSYVRMSI